MTTEPRFFESEIHGPVIIWKFHNPPKNLFTSETRAELDDLVEAFELDSRLRVAILTSALPQVFIQHFDVSSLVTWAEALRAVPADQRPQPPSQRPSPRGIGRPGLKPIICAINGQTAGGGLEIALACDFRFMSRNATAGFPEVLGGILPGGGGTQRTARLLGTAKELEMILLGKPINADEAERIGLVHRACDPEELMPAALEFAKQLATRPPLAVAMIKRCIYEGAEMPLEDGLALERELFRKTLISDEALQLGRDCVAGGQDINSLYATPDRP